MDHFEVTLFESSETYKKTKWQNEFFCFWLQLVVTNMCISMIGTGFTSTNCFNLFHTKNWVSFFAINIVKINCFCLVNSKNLIFSLSTKKFYHTVLFLVAQTIMSIFLLKGCQNKRIDSRFTIPNGMPVVHWCKFTTTDFSSTRFYIVWTVAIECVMMPSPAFWYCCIHILLLLEVKKGESEKKEKGEKNGWVIART